MREFSKKLLFADYIIAIVLIMGFVICVSLNGAYTKEMYAILIENGTDISNINVPQLFILDGFGILLGTWIIQLGVSSGAYYMMSRSDHRIQLPMILIRELPDDVKERVDMTQIITSVLSTSDN